MTEETKDTVEEIEEEKVTPPTEEKKCKKNKADKKLEKEIEMLKVSLEEKEKELAEQKDTYLRLAAEYENFRRRSKAEREGVYSEACSDVVNDFLPVFDNIERAAAYAADEKVKEGINMMAKAFAETLAKLGVEEIECKTFDPNVHNAVMHVDDDTYGEGEIVEVFQKGFKRGEKVIRYAMVKTAN